MKSWIKNKLSYGVFAVFAISEAIGEAIKQLERGLKTSDDIPEAINGAEISSTLNSR
jgi:hypothetical protein